MGSYGIGVSRLVGAIIDAYHDEKGIIWPESVAPYLFGLIDLKYNDDKCRIICDDLYNKLNNMNLTVLYDDRNEAPGIKLAEMDLIGMPWQLRIGPRGIEKNIIELNNRKTNELIEINISDIGDYFTKFIMRK